VEKISVQTLLVLMGSSPTFGGHVSDDLQLVQCLADHNAMAVYSDTSRLLSLGRGVQYVAMWHFL